MTLEQVLSKLRLPPLSSTGLSLFSGGAEGADALFDKLMAEYAPNERCLHWSYDGHHGFQARQECKIDIPNSIAAAVADAKLKDAALQLGQSVPRKLHVKALFRRDVFQVLWVDAVYAVAWEDLEATYPLRIGGGTKWAAQAYINRFQPLGVEPAERCQLFFFEVNSSTWKKWDQVRQKWDILDGQPQPLCAPLRFAGIGTRVLPPQAVNAVTNLFCKAPEQHASSTADNCCPMLFARTDDTGLNQTAETLHSTSKSGIEKHDSKDETSTEAVSFRRRRRWQPKSKEAEALAAEKDL